MILFYLQQQTILKSEKNPELKNKRTRIRVKECKAIIYNVNVNKLKHRVAWNVKKTMNFRDNFKI